MKPLIFFPKLVCLLLCFLTSSINGTTICPNTQAKNWVSSPIHQQALSVQSSSHLDHAIYHHANTSMAVNTSGTIAVTSKPVSLRQVLHSCSQCFIPQPVTLGKYKSVCDSSLLKTLQWLPITFKIKSRLFTVTFRALHDLHFHPQFSPHLPLFPHPTFSPLILLWPHRLSWSSLNLYCLFLLQAPYSN